MIGDVRYAFQAASGAVLVLDATKGIEVGAEKMWKEIKKHNLPAIIYINKMDKENVKFDDILDAIKDRFGKELPFCVPSAKSGNLSVL